MHGYFSMAPGPLTTPPPTLCCRQDVLAPAVEAATETPDGGHERSGACESRQGREPRWNAAHAGGRALRCGGERRQGVLLTLCRCGGGAALGAGAQARRGGGACNTRRAIGHGRTDGGTQSRRRRQRGA